MVTPSINAERQAQQPPIWRATNLVDVLDMIKADVAMLRTLYHQQALDAVEAAEKARQPDYRIRAQVAAWERAQDAHWSWYKEILDASSGAAEGPESLGAAALGQGN